MNDLNDDILDLGVITCLAYVVTNVACFQQWHSTLHCTVKQLLFYLTQILHLTQ